LALGQVTHQNHGTRGYQLSDRSVYWYKFVLSDIIVVAV